MLKIVKDAGYTGYIGVEFEGSEVSTDIEKSLTNHCNEYWYIGSINAKSKIQKNMIDALYATGLYPYRASSICFSVIFDSSTLLLISIEVFLDSLYNRW